jgi:hypothetical protein
MPANSETILEQTTHPGDSSVETVFSEKYKGDGYYGRSDGLHTVQYNLTGFRGTVSIQASLAVEPVDQDWFTVYSNTYELSGNQSDSTLEKLSNLVNFTGNYVWIRARIEYTDGTVNSIILNH